MRDKGCCTGKLNSVGGTFTCLCVAEGGGSRIAASISSLPFPAAQPLGLPAQVTLRQCPLEDIPGSAHLQGWALNHNIIISETGKHTVLTEQQLYLVLERAGKKNSAFQKQHYPKRVSYNHKQSPGPLSRTHRPSVLTDMFRGHSTHNL